MLADDLDTMHTFSPVQRNMTSDDGPAKQGPIVRPYSEASSLCFLRRALINLQKQLLLVFTDVLI
jgi:hypothetical protein